MLNKSNPVTAGVILWRRTFLTWMFMLGALVVNANMMMAQAPKLLVVCREGGDFSLAVIDPKEAKLAHRVPISGSGLPHEMTVSPDGQFAFVTRSAYAKDFQNATKIPNGAVSVIDLKTPKELRLVDIGFDSIPHGIVYAKGKVFFTAEGYRTIGSYDPGANRIDWMFGTGLDSTHMLAVSSDTNKILITDSDSSSVMFVEPWEREGRHSGFRPMKSTVIPVGSNPDGIALSPDEKQAWVLNRGEGSVSIIDVNAKKVLETVNLKSKDPLRLQFAPNGKQVVIIDETGEVLVMDATTRKQIARIQAGGRLHGVLVSPDSSTAYVSVYDKNKILVIDLKKGEVVGSIVTPSEPETLAWAY